MNYTETYTLKMTTVDLEAGGKKYRMEITVRIDNTTTEMVISTVMSRITTDAETSAEVKTRVGSASLDTKADRHYLAYDHHSEVPLAEQSAIADAYLTAINSILSE